MAPTTSDPGPLAGLRVLDLTHMLAGPYCAMVLADLGADIVKVEPIAGEMIRSIGRDDVTDDQFGGYFQSVNRGKRSLAIDLSRPEGRSVLLRLAEQADVLLENHRPGVMERLSIGFEEIHDVNPRLVYGCLRGFGDPRTGKSPMVDWPAYDIVAQAMGGLSYLTGESDGQPLKVGAGVGDIFPGVLLATGILAAVMHVRAGGLGQLVDVSMYDSIVSLCERIVYQYSGSHISPKRQGNTHPIFEPYGLYECADGWVALAAPMDPYWTELCVAVGMHELAKDERFETPEQRRRHADELRAILSEWFRLREVRDVVAQLGGRVPIGKVNTAADLFRDPHLAARGMLVELEHPGQPGPSTVAGCPIKFTLTPSRVDRRAPLLGEDTDRVLAAADFSATEIAGLRANKIIR